MAAFGLWKYTVDRDATALAYSRAEAGGANACNCLGCRNFRLARERVYPSEFLALLDHLGIDPRKEAEAYHMVRTAPGFHRYGGWFHFVGSLDETGDFPAIYFGNDFSAWMMRASAPRLSSLQDLPAVELEFDAEAVPWLLEEPEPT
jgi:hypothetical protein